MTLRPVRSVASLAPLLLLLAGCELPEEPVLRAEERPSPIAVSLQASNAEAAKLYRVVERWFNDHLALNPIFATELGDPRFDDRFGDYASASWMADSLGIEQEALERLAAVDPEQLGVEDRSSYDAFRFQRELAVHGYRYPSELLPLSQVENRALEFAELGSGRGVHPFRTTRDYDHFLARMDGFVDWSEQVVNNLRAGVSKGVLLPKVVVARTVAQLEPFARLEDPRATSFWWPLLELPPAPSVGDRRRLIAAYDEKLRKRVFPAYARLHAYLADEYLPQARDSIAWSELPGGELWYAWLVRVHSTTELAPRDAHASGLEQVARLREELARLQPEFAVAGDVRALLEAMRADPKFRVEDMPAVLRDLDALRRTVDERLATQFGDVAATAPAIAFADEASAREAEAITYLPPSVDGKRSARLRVDPARLVARRTYDVEPAFVHAYAGRHARFHAVAATAANLPGFLRYGREPAHVDGFAAYAESLGPALGLYGEAPARFGALVRRHKRDSGRHDETAPLYDYQVVMGHHDVVIEPEDHVIVFAVNKRIVPKVEKLFQVSVSFL